MPSSRGPGGKASFGWTWTRSGKGTSREDPSTALARRKRRDHQPMRSSASFRSAPKVWYRHDPPQVHAPSNASTVGMVEQLGSCINNQSTVHLSYLPQVEVDDCGAVKLAQDPRLGAFHILRSAHEAAQRLPETTGAAR